MESSGRRYALIWTGFMGNSGNWLITGFVSARAEESMRKIPDDEENCEVDAEHIQEEMCEDKES
jgi:hypothetical protein